MKEKIIEWMKKNKHFIIFENNDENTYMYMFRMTTEITINKNENGKGVFIEYSPKENVIKIIIRDLILFSKPYIVFTTDDQELINILEEVLLPYKHHTFKIIDSGFLVRIDDEENFREVDGITELKKDLMGEADDEAIPEIESFINELKKEVVNKAFYIKATLKLRYLNDYMFVEIIKI